MLEIDPVPHQDGVRVERGLGAEQRGQRDDDQVRAAGEIRFLLGECSGGDPGESGELVHAIIDQQLLAEVARDQSGRGEEHEINGPPESQAAHGLRDLRPEESAVGRP